MPWLAWAETVGAAVAQERRGGGREAGASFGANRAQSGEAAAERSRGYSGAHASHAPRAVFLQWSADIIAHSGLFQTACPYCCITSALYVGSAVTGTGRSVGTVHHAGIHGVLMGCADAGISEAEDDSQGEVGSKQFQGSAANHHGNKGAGQRTV